MEIGIHTFASANFKDDDGNQIPNNQAINELLDRIEHADKIGINGSIQFLTKNDEELQKFKPDFGQELRFNFLVKWMDQKYVLNIVFLRK